MSKQKSNRYEKKAAKSNIVEHLAHGLPTKHNIKNTLLETGKDLVIGVLGGGLIGAAIGKPSLLVGLGVAGIGHFTEHNLATLFGIGIMAANGFENHAVSGLDGMDGVKERVTAYKDSFADKLYIKHIAAKKPGIHGLGDLQFFNYAHDIDELHEMRNELSHEMDALDEFEKQIEQSGASHAHSNGINIDEADEDDQSNDMEEQDEEHDPQTSHTAEQIQAQTPEAALPFDLHEVNI
jgi:hypothetical protein